MKRLGLVLALLVLGSLFVGMGSVSATTWENTGIYIKFGDTTVLMPVLTYDYTRQGYYFGYWAQDRQSFKITLVLANGTNITVTDADFVASYTATSDGYEVYLEKLNLTLTEGQIKAVKWQEFAGATFTYEFDVLYGGIATYILDDGNPVTFSISPHVGTVGFIAHAYTDWGTTKAGDISIDGITISGTDYNFNLIKFTKDEASSSVSIARVSGLSTGVVVAFGEYPFQVVTFSIKDALTGQPLTGVTVKEGDTTLGTLDDGGTLELAKGTHELTFEKSGYWSASVTVDVQADTSVNVELYPSSAAFKFVDFPENLSFYVGTTNTLSFTVEPIETTATKNAYLRFSGITPEKVTVNGAEVSPEGGKYYLGDVTGPVSVSVTFKAPESSGTKSFSIAVESYDLTGNAYTTTKAVTYEVRQLPFIIDWPTWSVGENRLMFVEQSGESYLIEVSVTDANGSEIFADSHLFNPYESYTFSFNLPDTGTYTLTIRAKGGAIVLEREISAAYPVELKTKTVTAAPGDVATVALELGNPGDQVVYYNITLSGSVLGAPVTKAVSVAPGSTKTVYIDFKVPENPEFDAYTLTVEVSTGGAVVFSDDVTLTISDDGFSLGLGALGGSGPFGLPTWAWVILGLVAVGLVVRSRKKRG